MEKFLLNPKASNAFTSEVMHKVVLNGIDFELPEHIWDAIDEDPGILLQIADAFSISIKPLIDKLDRVVDPNS